MNELVDAAVILLVLAVQHAGAFKTAIRPRIRWGETFEQL